ncbi:elongation factor Ts [Candidatus Peregrinibacteria bacterium]|nr:elongation factor Ts [Candidatus Peregrinibacteria bacterium]
MTISLEQIKALRDATGISTMSCKKALEEAQGDSKKAIEILRKKGEAKAGERAEKSTGEGIISSYIHTNKKIGVLIALGCETDFVAKNEDFMNLGQDIAMHVAALNPQYLRPEDVPADIIEKEREIWKEQLKNERKPEKIWNNIMEGKEKKFKEGEALLSQPFVKNLEITIEKLISEHVIKLGENIKILKFIRFSL